MIAGEKRFVFMHPSYKEAFEANGYIVKHLIPALKAFGQPQMSYQQLLGHELVRRIPTLRRIGLAGWTQI